MSPVVEGLKTRHRVGQVSFVAADLDVAVRAIGEHARHGGTGMHVHLLNAYSVALAEKHADYRDSISGDAVNLPDGKPVGWVSRIRGDQIPLQQIRGIRFFLRTFEHGAEHGLRHFLLGSTPETLELLEANLRRRFPSAQIVGIHSPPFRELSDEERRLQDAMIHGSGADIVWVGLGTPKQDFEAKRLSQALPVTAAAVGAAFDFVAGTAEEAPTWMTRVGLEWLFRLASEPRRLWKRYTVGNFLFLVTVARARRLRSID